MGSCNCGYPTEYFIDEVPEECICQACNKVLQFPIKVSGCTHVVCYGCIETNDFTCPVNSCGNRCTCHFLVQDDAVEERVNNLHVHCPSDCGWFGSMSDCINKHLETYCLQYSGGNGGLSRTESIHTPNAENVKPKLGDLLLRVVYLQKWYVYLQKWYYCLKVLISILFWLLNGRYFHMLMNFIASILKIHKDVLIFFSNNDENRRFKKLVETDLKVFENHLHVRSDGEGGGGVYQTLTYSAWLQVARWTFYYARNIFSGKLFAVDVGAGLNLPAIIASYFTDVAWIGCEIDKQRVCLAAKAAIVVENSGYGHSSCGFLHADVEQPLNFGGVNIVFLWDRVITRDVVIGVYHSLVRSYTHPFLLVQSNYHWYRRKAILQECFGSVTEVDRLVGVQFKGSTNGSSDTLVLSLVAEPNPIVQASLPYLSDKSPSLIDYLNRFETRQQRLDWFEFLVNKCDMPRESRRKTKVTKLTYGNDFSQCP